MTTARPYSVAAAILSMLFVSTFITRTYARDLKVVAPESFGLSSERLARMGKAMQDDIDQKKTGGIVVLVARRGSIAYHKAFGFADIESGKKMQTDSVFRLYSMTKPVTSAALLMLYEEGKFQLSDPLEKYVPAFKGDVQRYRLWSWCFFTLESCTVREPRFPGFVRMGRWGDHPCDH